MSQTIEVDTREAQIAGVVQLFEDRLTSPMPEAGSWEELSRMLDGAPPWRAELNRRWGDRPDWKAFLEWEAKHQAARERKVLFAGFVVTPEGDFFVQRSADNQWGFELLSADQSWPGGIGAARKWTAVARESVPPEVEEELGWILDEGTEPVREEQQAAG